MNTSDAEFIDHEINDLIEDEYEFKKREIDIKKFNKGLKKARKYLQKTKEIIQSGMRQGFF